MTISVRLPPAKQIALARLAKTKGRTQSELVRRAIDVLLEGEKGEEDESRPYPSIVHLLGCADSGGRVALSEATGRRFTDLVRGKARARRHSR